jgi:hypothetical protein
LLGILQISNFEETNCFTVLYTRQARGRFTLMRDDVRVPQALNKVCKEQAARQGLAG